MAFIPLAKAGVSSATMTLRSQRIGAAVDRYNVIRNFFRQQHATNTPPQLNLLQTWRLRRSSLQATRLVEFRGTLNTYLSTRLVGVHLHARHLHATSGRNVRISTSGEPPKTPPQNGLDTHPERDPSTKEPLGEDPDLVPLPPDTRYLENYSRFFQRLASSVPHPHRPTRDDLLNVATNFWQRLRIRFKWFTIKSFRKFNADDISAFVTWFLMSQTLWILVGT